MPRTRTGGNGRPRPRRDGCETWSEAAGTHLGHRAHTTPYARRRRQGVPFFMGTISYRHAKPSHDVEIAIVCFVLVGDVRDFVLQAKVWCVVPPRGTFIRATRHARRRRACVSGHV